MVRDRSIYGPSFTKGQAPMLDAETRAFLVRDVALYHRRALVLADDAKRDLNRSITGGYAELVSFGRASAEIGHILMGMSRAMEVILEGDEWNTIYEEGVQQAIREHQTQKGE